MSTAMEPTGRTCPACGRSYPADFAICPRDATPLASRGKDPLLGVVLAGTYKVIRVLGEGGMARLYEAEHVRLARRCAVKVIHDDLARTPDLLARFEREARAAARIHSEHIVSVIDVLRTPDARPCFVAELLDGEDLQARLDRVGRMTPAEAIPIARQICRALDAAHGRGVVHRDLKPSNVFLVNRENGAGPLVKVLDFGVAKLSDGHDLTQTGAVVGTPAYMAPEQAKRASEAGPLADLYSVGAVLYRMVTGEPPYGSDPPVNPLFLLLEEEPARPRTVWPALPTEIEAVIQHAMARDPAARPASALALDAELAAFDATPAAGAPSSPAVDVEELTRTARQARPLAAFWAALAALSAGLYLSAFVSALLGTRAVRTDSEGLLIALCGVAAAVAVGAVEQRILAARWRSAPAVSQVGRLIGRSVLAGLATIGTLELGVRAGVALPGGVIGRLLLGGLAAGAAAALPYLVSRWVRGHDGAGWR